MKLAVLGGGESGVGAAILAKKQGYEVFLSDMGTIKEQYREMLDQHGIAWEDGHHTAERILDADEVVKSPGIPDTAPLVKALREKGTSIISEIEFAGRYTDAKMVCITGSNGKTTTTSLIYHIFREAGMDVGLAGNIGHSLALQVAEEPHEWYVVELSSFQLDGMYKFRAHIAVLLNITPDHLDRYNFQMQLYTDSKMRILQNQTDEDYFIYWAGDPVVKQELKKYDTPVKMLPFSEKYEWENVAYVFDTRLINRAPRPFAMPEEDMALPGRHNVYNQLAASLAANAAGIDHKVIHRAIASFPGVEHRLEKVGTRNGVTWVNDSKATNVDACYYALESMKEPTILILGGLDKGNDYTPIIPLVKEKCVGLVYLGADNAKLHDSFDALGLPVRDTHSMEDCVKACRELAQPGQTVLLSPCCASFDLFNGMSQRGRMFKQMAMEDEK